MTPHESATRKFQDSVLCSRLFRDSGDVFILGVFDDPGGRWGSLPVMLVAVGGRLGYPLKLVQTARPSVRAVG